MKKFLAWMLATVLVLSMCTTVLASETSGSGKIESTEEGSNTNSKSVTASYTPTVVGEAEITGVSISGVTKNEEGIYVVRDDDWLTITIEGKNLQNATDNHLVMAPMCSRVLSSYRNWSVSPYGTAAMSEASGSAFRNCSIAAEICYTNDYGATLVKTGIKVLYDDGVSEDERAEVTGVTVTVDGTTYGSGETAVLSPNTKNITFTLTGTNLTNVTDKNYLCYARGIYGLDNAASGTTWDVTSDTSATYTEYPEHFRGCVPPYEVKYSNDDGATEVNTGLYIKYVTGSEEEESAEITGVTITVGGTTYGKGETAIIKEDSGDITVTVTGNRFDKLAVINKIKYSMEVYNGEWYTEYTLPVTAEDEWTIDTSAGTATITMDPSWFTGCTTEFEVMYTNGGDYIGSGLKVKYDNGATGPAEMKTVSVTVDGKTYTSGQTAIITPESGMVTIKVSGENLGNMTADYKISYISGSWVPYVAYEFWTIEKGSAILHVSSSAFAANTTAFEILLQNGADAQPVGSGVKTLYVSDETSVDITWGDMAFTYRDADAANNVSEGWTSNTEGGSQVKVSNSGRTKITASAAYQQASAYSEISGSFDTASADLGTAESQTFTLTLTGKPAQGLQNTEIGTVKITIAKFSESNE